MLPQNEWGSTALSLACVAGYVETATVLLEYGAYVDQQNKVFGYRVHMNLLTEGYCTTVWPISSLVGKRCW
jgi:ankyrin repeat protein